ASRAPNPRTPMKPEEIKAGRVYRRNRWHRWFVESVEDGKATASRLGSPAIDSVETFASLCDLDITPVPESPQGEKVAQAQSQGASRGDGVEDGLIAALELFIGAV